MDLFLRFLDQFRYMAGTLVTCVLICYRVLPRKNPYAARLAVGAGICLLLAFCYVPLQSLLDPVSAQHPLVIAPYWLLMSFTPVWFVYFVYETNYAGALFRSMMAAFAENAVTVITRSLFVHVLFPSFPGEHPLLYILFLTITYTVFFWTITRTLSPRIRIDAMERFTSSREIFPVNLLIYLSYTALLNTSKYVMEVLILPLSAHPDLAAVYRYLQLFLTGFMLLLSVMMSAIMWFIYRRIMLEAEKEVIIRLSRERKSQYEFSRENIEMINRKTHDLKHQLRALSLVSDEERRQQIEETSRAIDFYDAVVKTGNEALDILLTEKSVYCANRQIRLSCTVTSRNLDKIRLIDLYTLFGNALDNAIESTEKLSNPEQKVISLSIRDQGSMLYIQLENYFEGSLNLHDGLPGTTKQDVINHGYGLRSIQNIVRHYGGQLSVRTEDHIFYLDIMIP